MNNHTYRFGNQIRKQSKGGPIGLDLTGAIAQIYMIWWAEELKSRLSSLLIEIEAKKCASHRTWLEVPEWGNYSR